MPLPSACSTLIIGAGVIGSAIAASLARRGVKDILVIDPDLGGEWSSSELNAGGVRATWHRTANVDLAIRSIEYFEKHREELEFRQLGYTWLHTEASGQIAQQSIPMQDEFDLDVTWLEANELQKRFPFLDKLESVAGATFSPRDGLLSPNALKQHFRRQAREHGVIFQDRVWAGAFDVSGDSIQRVALADLADLSVNDRRKLFKGELSPEADHWLSVDTVVSATGAWAGSLAKAYGKDAPVVPVRRQISLIESPGLDLSAYGMFVDVSGVYFHHEAGGFLAGFAEPETPPGFNFDYDGDSFFEERIWVPLYERSSHFEALRHVTGWAGLYEMTPDGSGIAGLIPGLTNGFQAHGFSGHGVMQSYSVGEGLAELIHTGALKQFGCLRSLDPNRFADGATPLKERLHI